MSNIRYLLSLQFWLLVFPSVSNGLEVKLVPFEVFKRPFRKQFIVGLSWCLFKVKEKCKNSSGIALTLQLTSVPYQVCQK